MKLSPKEADLTRSVLEIFTYDTPASEIKTQQKDGQIYNHIKLCVGLSLELF